MNNNQSPIEQFLSKLAEQSQAALCREEMPSEYISDLIAMLKAAIEGLRLTVGLNTEGDIVSGAGITALDTLAHLNTLATEAMGTKGAKHDA